jgi:triacylglycerol esterase/lipase EstA (alpha/beta hydrolase family)
MRMLDRPVTSTETARVLTTSGALTDTSRATLNEEGLLDLYKQDPDGAIRTLAGRFEKQPTGNRRITLAEMCADIGDKLTRERPNAALGHYLDTARLCQDAALAAVGKQVESLDSALYNYSASRLVRVLHDMKHNGSATLEAKGGLRSYRLNIAKGTNNVSPTNFDLVVPASWIELKGIDLERVTQNGFGAPMIGHIKGSPERRATEPLMPQTGHSMSLNASVRFSGSQATLVLQDLMMAADARVAGREVPLAADFTAPLAFRFYEREQPGRKLLATLRPSKFENTIGLYSLEPFRKDRIPLVLVHGLMSTAEGWLPFANLLRADPVVREKYQLIFFNYPTGSSISKNATELRKALATFRKDYDPGGRNPNMRNMVILGHSMGGILSNMQIRDSGNQLEELVFSQPLEELELDSESRATIEDRVHFDANPDIRRAIFIAAPHRGSDFASNPIGNFGAWLIRLPFGVIDALLGDVLVVSALNSGVREATERPRNSVSSLRPDNPFLPAVLNLPIRKGVVVHSLIAQRNPEVPILEGNDGVVSYTSAHLDGVASEKVFPNTNHRSVVEDQRAIEEVWRILYLHAGVRR